MFFLGHVGMIMLLPGMSIAAAFRPAPADSLPNGKQQRSAIQQSQLQEDLFVMTAAGGLVRHKLMLHHSTQTESDSPR